MAIFTEKDSSRCTVRIRGRFDFSCRGDFRACYATAPKGMRFLVDFSEVDYVDSAALGMLLMLRDHAGDPTHVTLTGCRGQPEQVLKIANFHKIFRFE